MLDTTTKKRIDDCRDILVGKLPDPKAQIEQITIALIYKFMDDMDKEAIELGAKPKFFSGDFEKYSWDNLFDPKVTAKEMLTLYSDAIASMDKNPNIPQLFRDIFKNAFLPYRDPETLKLFLKTIGEFEYTHSEKLGDAFEYLLSVMGSQGDAGQFRTPRHIIDFLVAAVDPCKTDTILDPACGTAGFLISAFKHILLKDTKSNKDCLNIFQYNNSAEDKPFNNLGDKLTPDSRKRLIKNFTGYDISPDMVRLSLVNLYLHGFSDPHIWEYDTLSSEERWNESFDVILANPPFMSPKGGIRPHKKFSIGSNRSEVLFVDYIAEHLNPGGRAGIIVPEGIIFQSGTAYKSLRKMLVENYLYAVVSLPAGVFNPYSGVKTSILLMDKELSKKNEEILFVKIENDGYGLGAQRNAVQGGQLEEAIDVIKRYKEGSFTESSLAHSVPKAEIAKNGDYNLSGERYRIIEQNDHQYFSKKIGEICVINPLKSELKNVSQELIVSFVPMADLNENKIYFEPKQTKTLSEIYNSYTYFAENDVIMAKVTPCFENGKAGIAINLSNGIGFGSSEFYVLRAGKDILPKYLYSILKTAKFYDYAIPKMTGTGGLRRVPKNVLSDFQIPLPPISVQEEIVAEIEGYQKIIDGAKMVVENYKPHIDIDPEWEMVELGEVCEHITKGTTPTTNGFKWRESGINFIKIENINTDGTISQEKLSYIDEICHENLKRSQLKVNDILFSIAGTKMGIVGIVDSSLIPANTNQALAIIRSKGDFNPSFLKHYLMSANVQVDMERIKVGVAQSNLSLKQVSEIKVPKVTLDKQQQIVSYIEKEQELINANKQLIEIFERKIKDIIAKVWGE